MKQNELELLRKLAQKASEMRANQKLYFQYKSHSALTKSQQLEKEVDTLIKKLEKAAGEIQISSKGTPFIQPKLLEA